MESIRTQLRRLTIPIFMELSLIMLVGAVDTFMLSSCGDGTVAAVGLVNQLVMLVFLVYQFVSLGVGIVCAQYHGAGLRQRLVQAVGIAWVFAIPFGWGLIGAWIAFSMDENFRGIVLMRRWHSKDWQGKSLA